jgi:hypothetical protein
MAKGYCPNCGSEINLGISPVMGQIVQCWHCKSRLRVDKDQPSHSELVKRTVKLKKSQSSITK